MARELTEIDKKRIAEIVSLLRAIEDNRRNLKVANPMVQVFLDREKAIHEAYEQKLLQEEEYQETKKRLEEEIKKFNETSPDFINNELSLNETYLFSLLDNTSEEAVPQDVKTHIKATIADSERDFDTDEIKAMIIEGIPTEAQDEIEEIEAEIDTSAPTKEIIKSFRTMAKAISAALEKVKEAIAILDEYLKSKNINVDKKQPVATVEAQAKTEVKTETAKEVTVETPKEEENTVSVEQTQTVTLGSDLEPKEEEAKVVAVAKTTEEEKPEEEERIFPKEQGEEKVVISKDMKKPVLPPITEDDMLNYGSSPTGMPGY
ncbi:MAG: hypothetical protein IE916_00620 [Epsilonproteobacteria bacterium]|nr:hypothetical protein [Campylobacterota bacterium]